jgi:aldehyde dehydrogenase (NAD+)
MATAIPLSEAPDWPHRLLIDGALVDGGGPAISVENPADGQEFTTVPGADEAQFETAIRAARRAADEGVWAAMDVGTRVAILFDFISALEARRDALKRIVVAEAGCPIGSFMMEAQVDGPLNHVKGTLNLCRSLGEIEENPLPLDERINPAGKVVQSIRRYIPVGVVSVISAYNFPLFLNIWKSIPALATGNCVILRASPLTPLSALAMAEAAMEAGIPSGVLNILVERDNAGAMLMTTHPMVDLVSFTGSTEVGRKVMAQAAPTLKRLQLELGGKSAQIFLPDSVEGAFSAAAGVCLAHAGQGCVLGTRIFVPEAEKPAVLAAMKASLEAVTIGDPADPLTQMGPVITAAQVERCERYVALAVKSGGTVITGGNRVDRAGHYFEPTVIDVPGADNPAARDEIFGPIVTVIGYRDIDHAIAMANDSEFGLSGYVFGKDARQALDVAKRIRSGTINVNLFGHMSGYVSSGGHKQSGIARERGVEGLRVYQEIQCLNFAN